MDPPPEPDPLTSWVYPPALNRTFIDNFYRNDTDQRPKAYQSIEGVMLAAVHNISLSQRLEPGFTDEGFGRDDVIVRVDDVLGIEWNDTGNRSMEADCVICSRGVEGGSIYQACDNYTDTSRMRTTNNRVDRIAPGTTYQLPTFSDYFEVPVSTCGICILTLSSLTNNIRRDYSVPFPVLQESRMPHHRFDRQSPTGVEDASISSVVTASAAAPQSKGSSVNVGMIVGVVVGVLGGVALLAGLCFWLWRRRVKRAKTVDSEVSSTVGGQQHNTAAHRNQSSDGNAGASGEDNGNADPGTQSVPLQPMQGVARRPDTSASEVPPAYHDIVRNQSQRGRTEQRSVSPVSSHRGRRDERSISPIST